MIEAAAPYPNPVMYPEPLALQIQRHAMSVSTWLARRLRELRHFNGQPMIHLFGNWEGDESSIRDRQGPVLNFVVLDRYVNGVHGVPQLRTRACVCFVQRVD